MPKSKRDVSLSEDSINYLATYGPRQSSQVIDEALVLHKSNKIQPKKEPKEHNPEIKDVIISL